MAKGSAKQIRCPKWSHEETLVLAGLKKDFSFKKQEGRLVWEQIAHLLFTRFPDQKRSHDQCRRRWETLTKTYNHIEEYCTVTGQDHWQLDEEELRSMKLDTAYGWDWYSVVKQVCSQRKRKEKPDDDFDLVAMKWSKNDASRSSVGRYGVTHVTPQASNCEPATTSAFNGQSSTRPISEAEKLSLVEENRRLQTMLREKDNALNLAWEQLQQGGQAAQQNQVSYDSPAEVRAHVKEPLQDMVGPSSKAAHEHDNKSCELMVATSLSFEVFFSDLFDSSTNFSCPAADQLWESDSSWINGIRLYFVRTASAAGRSLILPNKDPNMRQGDSETLELLAGSSLLHDLYSMIIHKHMVNPWQCRN